MQRLIITTWVVGCFCINSVGAIGLADFVPNFLTVDGVSSTKQAKSHQVVLDSSNMGGVVTATESKSVLVAGGCFGSNISVQDSVFCQKQQESTKYQLIGDESSGNIVNVEPSRVGNGVAPNLNSLQSSSLRSALGRYDSNYMLSIKPADGVNIGIGATDKGFNGLQFNMKY